MTTSTSAGLVPAQRRSALSELAEALRGRVEVPGSPAYERLTSSGAAAGRPVAVAVVADAYDVVRTVRTAAAHGLRVAVRCTGQGAVSPLDGAVLVHTAALDELVVHRDGWVRVGAGVRWRTVLDAAAPLGLTGLAGWSGDVGVVGHMSGGGTGPLARTSGLASDRVRALDVVTGQGRLLRVTATEHEDLFWSLRGGRGSAGVVTAVELDLVELAAAHGAALHFAAGDVAAVLHAWPGWAERLPATATTSAFLVRPPKSARLERPTLRVRLSSLGAAEQVGALLAPLLAVADPVLTWTGPLTAGDLHALHAEPVHEAPALETTVLLRTLPEGAVDALLRLACPPTSTLSTVEVRQLGGAAAQPGRGAGAVPSRDGRFCVRAVGHGAGPAKAAADLVTALAPWSTGSARPQPVDRLAAYDDATLQRLRSVVLSRDPQRVLLAADPLFAPSPAPTSRRTT